MSLTNINAKLNTKKTVSVTVNQEQGRIQTTAPLSLRNTTRDNVYIQNIEDIENVVILNRVDGSGLQYNSETKNYEIKLMSLDGGQF